MTDAELAPFEEDQVAEAERELERKRLSEIDVRRLRKMVDDFRDGTEPGRLVAQKCRRYFDGDQLDAAMITALRRSRQPQVIRNEIAPAVRGLLGIIQQAKVDPKAYPRNPGNEGQSDVASKALRYVADRNRLHRLKVNLAEDMLIEGAYGVAVEMDEREEVALSQVRYDEMIYDPRSREADFSDANYKGVGKWMYEQDVRAMYPDFADEISGSFSASWGDFGLGEMFADKPDNLVGECWMDRKKRRLFIVELHHREPEWMRTVFFIGGVLESDVSPYQDADGQPISNLVFGSCFVNGQNQRYGVVASMLKPQDELNAYSSRALHLANSRQIQAATGVDPMSVPEVDSKVASLEAAKPNGVIPVGWQVVPTTDLLQSIQLMISDARQALVRQAPTPAVLADASSSSQSGRSRLVLQQAGMTEIARVFGRLEDSENEIYRMVWNVLRQFKRAPWWVRVTGDDGKQQFMPVNMPVGQDGQPLPPEMAQQAMMMGLPMPMANNLAEMDVDIEVETIPDTANLQAEQFETIGPMLPLLAQAKGPEAAFKVGLALSSFPDKQRIKELLDAPVEQSPEQQQAAAAQAEKAQQVEALTLAKAQADIAETNSKALLNDAKAKETEANTVVKAMDAMMPVDVRQQ